MRSADAICRRPAGSKSRSFESNQPITLDNLSVALGHKNRWREALPVTAEVITIHRRLVGENPEAYTPVLAGSLFRLAMAHAQTESPSDAAVAAARQAAEIYQSLSSVSPDAYFGAFASCFNCSQPVAARTRQATPLA